MFSFSVLPVTHLFTTFISRSATLRAWAWRVSLGLCLVLTHTLTAQVPAGTLDTAYIPGIDTNGYVIATALQPDGKMIIGGGFTTVGGAAHANIARLNVDGSVDATFTANVNNEVQCMAIQTDGKLVVGGYFSTVNGTPGVNRIARLNADGTRDTSFNSGTGMNNPVFSVAVQTDGKLVLGGTFTSFNGSALSSTTGVNRIARLNADGTRDTSFNSSGGIGLGGADGDVNSVVVQTDGKLVLGGGFNSVNGSALSSTTGVNRIARLNADGTRDTSFNSSGGVGLGGVNGTVRSVAVQADGKLVLGGSFAGVNGSAVNSTTGVNNIARLNADGTHDTAFNSSGGIGLGGVNNTVYSVAVQADGKLVLGGNFTSVNGSTVNSTTGVNRIARLNADGTRDTSFNSSGGTGLGGANPVVYGVALQADGKLVLGGFLTSLNGSARSFIGRLTNDPATQSLTAADSTQVLWTRGGSSPEVSQVTFELSTNGGSSYTPLGGTATRVGSTSDWQLTGLSLPASGHLRATGRVTGSSGLVQSAAPFTVPVPPTVTGISPASGSTTGGTAVTITGTNFTGATAVTIGGTAATGLNVVNATSITATTPSGSAGTASVLVTTPGGTNAANTLFTYNAPPTVTANTSDFLASAATLTIAGTHFSGTAAQNTIVFTPALTYTVTGATPTSLTVAVSGLLAGPLSAVVTVTTTGLNSGTAVQVANVKPVIASSTMGVTTTDTTLTIHGYGFVPGVANNSFVLSPAGSGTLTAATTNTLTITSLTGLNLGTLNAVVTTNGHVTPSAQVATVIAPPTPGSVDLPFDVTIAGSLRTVYTTALQPDGKMILGGNFTTVGGETHYNIARLNTDGSVDASFQTYADNEIQSVAVQPDGKIVITGLFVTVNGSASSTGGGLNHLARLNADGTTDATFSVAGGTTQNPAYLIASQATQPDGKILIGGGFISLFNTGGINRIARINANGGRDTSFVMGTGANSTVNSIALQPDGKVLIAGDFTAYNSQVANRIARLGATGTLDSTFITTGTTNGTIHCIALQPDGKVIVGGDFTILNGVNGVNYIGRLNADATVDTTFNTGGAGPSGSVYSVAIQTSGKLVVGGNFTTYNGIPGVNRVTRLNANGTRDTTFNTIGGILQAGADGVIYSVAVQADGRLQLGGLFDNFNGAARSRLARLYTDPATQSISVPDRGQILWTRGGAAPELNQAIFQQSTNGLTWTNVGAGTRVGTTSNWYINSINLPASVSVRARGFAAGGYRSASSSNIGEAGSFTALAAPALTVPPSTANLGVNATSLTITGTGFSVNPASNTVAFTPAGTTGTVTASNGTSLTVTVTGLSVGALSAVVTSNSVSSGAAVQVATVTPVVTLSTATLLTTDTTLTINGFGFDTTAANNTVAFSPAGTGTVTGSNATSLTVSSLSGLTAGVLNAVVTTNGVSSGTPVQVATVLAPPTVTAITPSVGSTLGGTSVTITGTEFTGASAVSIGGTNVTSFTVDSATEITAVTAAHAAGATSVLVTTAIGTNAANSLFTYVAPPGNPSGTDKTISLAPGAGHTFSVSDWGFSDVNSSPADAFSLVKLTTLPGLGSLTVDSTAAVAGQSVSVLSGAAGGSWAQRTAAGSRSWSSLASSADGSKLAAVVNGGYIYTSTDAGATWTEQTNSGSRTWNAIASSADGSRLAAAVNVGYVYTSTDSGVTWTERPGFGIRNWVAMACSADGVKLVGVAGGAPLQTSADGGATWTERYDMGSPAWAGCASSADGVKLCAASSNGYTYTSTDSGVSWTFRLTDNFRSWIGITSSANGSKLAAAESGGWIHTTSDSGVNWTPRMSDAMRQWRAITSSADGNKLAAVVNGGFVYTSTDAGVTWTPRMTDAGRTWRAITSSADGGRLAAAQSTAVPGSIYTSEGLPSEILYTAPATAGSTSFTFQVQDNGASDNLDLSPNTITITVAPTVTPSTVDIAANDTTLTINGFGFDPTAGSNTVAFTPSGTGTVTASTATSLTVTGLTGLTAGVLNAVVTVNGQNSGAPVQVATVKPVVTGGGDPLPVTATSLTINGFGFDLTPANNTVAFTPSGTTGTVTASTATTLTVTGITGLGAGALNAVVTSNGQASNSAQVASVTPVITSSTAPLSSLATSLTIDGFGFDSVAGNNTVAFTPSGSGTITSATPTQVTVTGITGLTPGVLNAVVTTFGQSSTSTQVATVVAAPTVTTVYPAFGSTAGGASVTITGTNLTGATAVTFGSTAATAFNVVNATTIICTTPAHAAGAVDVSVTTPGGTATLTNGYTYYVGSVGGVAFSNFMDATTVVGQTNFTNQATTAGQVIVPSSYAANVSSTGKMVISDFDNGRVLIWNSVPTSNGAPADVVVGKPDFTATTAGCTQSLMAKAGGTAFSPDGQKLIVSDTTNHRVLIWNTVPTTNGAPADVVIGQTNFTTNTFALSATKLEHPGSVLVTPDGKLLVADGGNHRVLVYNSIPTSNGVAANVVIGQPSLTTREDVVTANRTGQTYEIALTAGGRLLVADHQYHRVLVFNSVPTTNSASADVVIGQTGFTQSAAGTSQTTLRGAQGVAVSSTGQLAISDTVNHRVLIYNSVPNSHGAAADFVLGQPDFTSNTALNGGISARSMSSPNRISFAADGRLIVPGTSMKRAMIYGTAAFAPTIASIAPTSGTTLGGTSVTITGTNFTGATAVSIGGTAVTTFTVDSATQISATTAAHAAGASSILVTTTAGTNAANTLFTYFIPNVAPTDITLSPTSIAENNAANATVGTLTATDADAGQSHAFTLVSGTGDTDNSFFTIDGTDLKITPVANFEAQPSYAIRVRATDDGIGNLAYEKELIVSITNVNEAPVVVVDVPLIVTLEGNTFPHANSGTLVDVDSSTVNLAASFGTVTVTPVDPLNVTSTNATWTWTSSADDGPATSTITITATDDAGLPLTGTDSFTFTILNTAPTATFTASPGTTSENTSTPPSVGFSGQIDPSLADVAAGFRYSYDFDNDGDWELGDGTYAGSSTNSNATVPSSYFAASAPDSLTINGCIVDKDGGSAVYTTVITINHLPTDIALSPASIAENNAANATVGTLSATDPDLSDTHSFTLVSGLGDMDNGSFTITGTSLNLTPVANFEVKPSYALRVQANDGHGGLFAKALTVTILNVNEAPSLETSHLAYETVTPRRDVSDNIVYSVNNSVPLASASFNRVRYRMETRVDGVLRNADVAFDAWTGLTTAGLVVPTQNNQFIIQRNVSNMTVASNFTGRSNATAVTTGSGFTGRLEIWPYNYTATASGGVGGSSTRFDYDDTPQLVSYWGTFQVHNMSALTRHTVLAWNNHGIPAPEVGFGNQIGSGAEPDWTFCVANGLGTTDWKLQIFLGSEHMLTLAENSAAGTTAGPLSSVDADAGDSATFTLVSGTGDEDNSSFTLSGSQLLSSAPFDFETKNTYNIRVRLTDTAGLFTESALVVNVTDVNEVPTDITLSPTSIAENNTAGATVGTLAATDPDAGQTHTYTLVSGGADNASFTITGTSLKLTPVANYEVKPTYALRVRATDSGTGSLFYEKALTVNITDVNEAPVIDVSQLVYETVTPRRNGSNNIVYSVNNSVALAGASFNRVRYRMETRVDTVLRYADVSFDAWAGLTTAGLSVPTQNNPFIIQRNVDHMTVASNFTGRSNATAVTTGSGFTGRLEIWPYNYGPIAAASPTVDGNSILYDWDDSPAVAAAYYGSFQVHNISAATKQNVFSWSSHGVAVQDVGFGNYTGGTAPIHPDWTFAAGASLGVTNWKLQIFIGSAPDLTLAENAPAGTSAGTLTSVDPDAPDTATYTLVTGAGDTDNGSFHISGTQLLSNAAFDFETKSSYTVRVRVTDTAGLFTESALLVSVTNVNEVPTALALTGSTVNENAAINTTVGTLSSTDPDAGETFTYTLVSGTGDTDNASFNISGGTLRTNAALDHEAGATRSVRVRTTDLAGLFVEDTFTLTVTNRNEVPSFTKGGDQRYPNSTTGAQSVPGWASNINDGDSTVTQALTFNVTNTANGMFSAQPAVNTATGDLTFTLSGTTGVATVSVSLTDDNTINGDAALTSAVQTFTITVDPAPNYTVSTTGNAIVVTDVSGNGETLTLSEPSVGSIAFAAAGRTFSIDGALNLTGASGPISLASVTSITVNAAAGNDTISVGGFSGITFPGLTLNGGLGDDVVAMTGDITFAANASLNADLQNDHATPGADSFTVSTNGNLRTSGTGTVTVRVSQGIVLSSGSSLETVNGDLTLEANQQATSTAAAFHGIQIASATVQSSGSGLVTLKGKGGSTGAGGNYGVTLNGTASITAGTTASITVIGTGGVATGGFNFGVSLTGTSAITTTGADISVTGVGGSVAAAASNYGIALFGGPDIYAGGSGSINLHGTGGNGTGSAVGAVVSDLGTTVSSASGNITITGIAGASTGGSNRGVALQNEAVIAAGGTGNLVVNGTGGSGTASNHGIILINTANANGTRMSSVSGNITLNGIAGAGSYGMRILDNGLITTADGALTLNGSAGTTGINGVNLNANTAGNGSGQATVTGTGSATIQGSTIILDATSVVNAGTRPVTLRGDVAGRAINLGAADVLGTVVGLTDAELDRITCGTLNIGGSTSGQVTVSAAITRAAATNVNVTSSSTTGIAFTLSGSLNANGGDVNLAGGELGVMSQNSSATVIADDLVLAATGDGEIGGGSRGFRFTANTITTTSDDYQALGSMGAVTIADNDLKAGFGTVELTLGTWSLTSTGSILSPALIGRDATLTGMGATRFLTNLGNLTPGAAGPGIITTDVLSLYGESSLNIEIGGTSPGNLATNHDQIQVGYGVFLLQGFTPLPALNVTAFGGFVPSVGQTYVIIRNDDTNAVDGHFEGLPEGTVMPNFLGSGLNALITYKGGDGNDVEIITSVPEIGVQDYLLTELVDGDTGYRVPFGTTDVGVGLTRSFMISNTGTGDLVMGAISFQTGESADFAVTTPPPALIPAGGNATFAVTFTALGSGVRNSVMRMANDDFDENPFDIQIGGVGSNTIGGTWTNPNTPPVVIPPDGSFVATGLNFSTKLGFVPVPNQTYTFIEIQGAPPAGIIGHFNDLPEGGVIAMAFNGTIYYFQADYTAGVDGNDLLLTNFTPSADPAWKWVSGPSSRNGVGIYGNLNVAAPTNNPGARQGPMNWLAQDGSLWMFGGYGYATAVTNPPRYLNDLWQYDRTLGNWIWRGGNNAPNQYGVYGTQGTEAAANAPGSRHTGTTWTDSDGNLWLFGGFGVGTTPGAASLNDLWRFNMVTQRWTWMKGTTVINSPAIYGTQGTAAAANTPGARSSATGFYRNGSLWLFGGYSGTNSYSDLWRYDIASGNWTWVSGSSTPNQNGVYGTQGTAAAGNLPGARRDATGWVAQDGTLWMFGGLGLAATGTALGDLNDLWKYDPVTGNWTWIKGASTQNEAGVYGTKDSPAPANLPGARSASSGWTTVDGKLWLVGGFKNSMLTFNDVWIYDTVTNEWTWKQGAAGTLSVPGVYGTQGVAAAGNQPGGRFTPSTWVTLNGSLWIFGGGGADKFGNTGRMSDLWSYGIPNRAGVPYDNEVPDGFPSHLIVNAPPSASSATAGTVAYVPVSGQLTGTDTDGDRILFSSTSSTTISQGTLTLNADGTWTYTPAFGFTGVASFQFKASDDYGGQSAVKVLVITVMTNPADSDGDGIADEYERTIWGNLASADGDGDADLDGQSNYFEFLAQTNPLDGAERLLTAPTVNAQGAVLNLNHVRPGVNYHLEISMDLKAWSRVGTFTFDVTGSATIEPPAPEAGTPTFYRVSLEATPAIILP